jgi:hypothetical protein
VQVLHPIQKLECPPFWNGLGYGIIKYGIKVIFLELHDQPTEINKSPLIFSKIIGGGGNTQRDRMVISLALLSFEECRLKIV